MPKIPDAFIDKLADEVAEFKQIEDASDLPKANDPIVKLACRIAYGQVEAYCARPLYKNTYTDCFEQVTNEFYLRVLPIISVASIKNADDDSLIDPAHYTVRGEKIILSDVAWFLYGAEEKTPIDLKVEYDGGYEFHDDDDILRTALVAQSIAMYNRKDLLGHSIIDTGKGTVKSSTDKGDIVEAVMRTLEPFIYYGRGYPC